MRGTLDLLYTYHTLLKMRGSVSTPNASRKKILIQPRGEAIRGQLQASLSDHSPLGYKQAQGNSTILAKTVNCCLSWDLWSPGDLTYVSVCCTNRVMDKPLTNATSFRENIKAEWTPGSRLSVINLNSHVVHVIISTGTLFTFKDNCTVE